MPERVPGAATVHDLNAGVNIIKKMVYWSAKLIFYGGQPKTGQQAIN